MTEIQIPEFGKGCLIISANMPDDFGIDRWKIGVSFIEPMECYNTPEDWFIVSREYEDELIYVDFSNPKHFITLDRGRIVSFHDMEVEDNKSCILESLSDYFDYYIDHIINCRNYSDDEKLVKFSLLYDVFGMPIEEIIGVDPPDWRPMEATPEDFYN